jgi:hypothetical protein
MANNLCQGKTISGTACRAPAGASGLCFFHANPDKTRALGQIGGQKNRSQVAEPIAVGSLTATGMLDVLAKAMEGVLSNTMAARNAAAIAQLCKSARLMLPMADREARLFRLEQRLAEQEHDTSVDTDPAGPNGQEETCGEADVQPGDALTPRDADQADRGSDGPDEEEQA